MEKPVAGTDCSSRNSASVADEETSAAHEAISGPIPADKEQSTETATDDYQYVSGIKLALVTISVTLAAFVMMLDMSIIGTAIPHITSEFHSLPDVGWYGSAYLLTSCSLQPLTGKIYTYFKSKPTFLTLLAIFEIGSLLCGVANSSKMLIVGRAVAGIGGAGLMNGAMTIIAASVPLEKRPLHLGIMTSCAFTGMVLGPVLGGALTEYATWRWCFYINLPAGGAVSIFLLLIYIPDRVVNTEATSTLRKKIAKLDLLGFLLFASATVQLLLAISWGGTRYRWGSATVIGLFCGFAGVFALFVYWQYRKGDGAMVPLSIVRHRIVWSSCLFVCLFMGSLLTFSYYMPIYFQAVRGTSPTTSAVYILPSILTQMLFATLAGAGMGRMGYYLPWVIGGGVLVTIGTGLLGTLTPTTSTAEWVGYQIIAGIGRGCGMMGPIIAVQNALPPKLAAIGTSLLMFFQNFGGALMLTFSQLAFTNGLANGLPIFAPGIALETVLVAGATGIRQVVSAKALPGVLLAYNQAIRHCFYLATGAAGAAFLISWAMGWKNIKKTENAAKKEKDPESEPAAPAPVPESVPAVAAAADADADA